MKKTLLLFALIVSLSSSATIFVFDVIPTPTATAPPYAIADIYGTSPDFIVNVTTIGDDNFVPFAYTATNLTTGSALKFSYKDNQTSVETGKKGLAYKNSEKAFIFDGAKRKLKISGLTIGDKIQFSIGSKGSTANTFTVTGATANANNPVLGAKPAEAYLYVIWEYTATATEAIFEVAAGGCIVNSIKTGSDVTTAVNPALADKGITISNNQINNPKNLSLEVFNMLGKKIAESNLSISTASFQRGLYVVRVAGTNEVLKFSK